MTSRALQDIYRRYGPSALRRARQILRNEQEARDVLHDVFVSLANQPSQFAGRSHVSTWLYAAMTHACLNRLRNRSNRARLLADNAERVTPNATAASPELAVQVAELLDRLPDDLAAVAVYYYLDEMTHAEIAELLGCSRRQVGNLLDRMRTAARATELVA